MMTQPINPNTNIPMSLQVEKIQQLKNTHNMQQQGQLSQQADVENKLKQQRVNSNTETDQARISKKEEQNQSGNNKNMNQNTDENEQDEKEDLKDKKLKKGRIIDVKV